MQRTSGTDGELRAVLVGMLNDVDELGDVLASNIRDNVAYYRTSDAMSYSELADVCRIQVRAVLDKLCLGKDFDTAYARISGRERAAAGIPLSVVMDAYRVTSSRVWDIIAESVATAGVPPEQLIAITSELWQAQGVFTQAMSAGYREQLTEQLLNDESERAAVVEALLTGRVIAPEKLWGLTDILRLPRQGPFVVVAAEVLDVGRHAIVGIERRLMAADLRSAWRLLPDMQVGIVSTPTERDQGKLNAVLSEGLTVRVGVSPRYPDLRSTGSALRFARIAMTGTSPAGGLTVFDDAPLSIAAVADPDVMRHLADVVLGPLYLMRSEDRTILLDTLETWFDTGGSAEAAAKQLFCHPNTVRQRLRRIEERTGRSLADPRQLAELCLALESERRLAATAP